MSNRKLNDREINTILHALRILQEIRTAGTGCRSDEESAVYGNRPVECEHFEDGLKPLDNTELDDLCESIGLDSLTLTEDEEVEPSSDAQPEDVWGEDEEYTREEWRGDVSKGDTNLGYWDWVKHNQDSHAEDEEDND